MFNYQPLPKTSKFRRFFCIICIELMRIVGLVLAPISLFNWLGGGMVGLLTSR